MGKKSDGGQAAMLAQARDAQAAAKEEFAKLELPDIEDMKLNLEERRLVGLLDPEMQEETSISDIEVDPRMREAQMRALQEMQGLGETGLGVEDKLALSEVRDSIAADEASRQDTILQQMAERGALDSGAQLAAQLSSSQSATQRASKEGDRLAAQAAGSRRDALMKASGMAGQMEQTDYGRDLNEAQARDAISQFNVGTRNRASQSNLGMRQGVADSNVNLRNQEQQANKALHQQDFSNRLAKTQGSAGGMTNQASQLSQHAAMAKSKGSNLFGTIGTIGGAVVGGIYGGGPAGASAGAAAGGAVGGAMDNYEDGGIKYKKEEFEHGEPNELGGRNYNGNMLMGSGGGSVHTPSMSEGAFASHKAGEKAVADSKASDFDAYAELAKTLGDSLGGGEEEQGPTPMPTNIAPVQVAPVENMLAQRAPIRFNDGGLRTDEAVDMGLIEPNVDAQKELLAMARGDIMPEDSSSGRIIGGDSYSEDQLPDRINSGEMVLNIDQQDKTKDAIDSATAQTNGFLKILEMIGKK